MENFDFNENANVIDSEIDTADFSAMFLNGFSDEQFEEKPSTNNIDGLEFKDNEGNVIANVDDLVYDPLEDDAVLPVDMIAFGDVQYERDKVAKAMEMHEKVDSFAMALEEHKLELDEYEENMNELYSISNSEINEYISHYQSILENDRIDPATRIEAHKEIQRYQGQRAQLEAAYKKAYNANAEAKNRAERLKGKAIANQLIKSGWKEKDFAMIGEYMNANNIVIPFSSASDSVMIALRKAAMFDEAQNKNKEDASNTVQRALAGKPVRASRNISPDDERRKARAKALANSGELSTNDMFKFLQD